MAKEGTDKKDEESEDTDVSQEGSGQRQGRPILHNMKDNLEPRLSSAQFLNILAVVETGLLSFGG